MIEERYEIIKLLGKGRTGGIYEAEDTNLGRKVAMRRFFAQNKRTDFAEYQEDFEKVAHSLSGLQHPNLLRVYDAGVDSDGAYIISQLLTGETLHNKIKDGPIPVWEVNDLAQQMLDALSTAHKEGFVHGAITPGSILMSPRARGGYLYVVLDMGLSRLAPLIQGKDSVLSIMADPAILAPELFDGGVATERADLYMLGHILYMCLAGGHPFGGVSSAEAEKLHQEGLPPLTEFSPDVPEDFRLWIEKLTQLDPEDRPANAVEALNSLPKVNRPARKHSDAVYTATAHLKTSSTAQLQAPAGNVTGPLTTFGVSSTGPLSGLVPAGATGAAAPGGIHVLPASEKGSKKGLFIIIGLVVAIGAVAALIVLKGGDDIRKTSADDGEESYAERNSVQAEQILITDFDGTKRNNKNWRVTTAELQKAHKSPQGLLIESGSSKQMPGLRFPLRAYAGDMFDLGWKLTYVVQPLSGAHRVGFKVSEKWNPGWDGGNVSVYLVVHRISESEVLVSMRDASGKIKKGKSQKVQYAGDDSWHTITLEQGPEDSSGSYVVSIDGKKAFDDTFTRGLKGYDDQIYNFAFDKKTKGSWVIKQIKLETP
ncbi:MAG: serine/threonine protein kinase [Akkermansiaceae bacterium]